MRVTRSLSALALLVGCLFPVAGRAQRMQNLSPEEREKLIAMRNPIVTIQVTDSSGAVVPRAHITLIRNETTETKVEADTDENGYASLAVKPGSYRFSVNVPGFREWHQQICIENADSRRLEVKLKVGGCPPGPCLTVIQPWLDALEPASPPLDSLWVDASVPLAYRCVDPCVNPETPGQQWLDQLMPISPLVDSVWVEEQ